MTIGTNKQLEQLFNLPETGLPEEPTPEVAQSIVEQEHDMQAANDMAERVDQALPQVRGIQHNDGEMDDIAAEAMQTYRDIKELAMNVEARHSAELLSVAADLLKTALDAKRTKTESKLRTVSLQLQALRAQAQKPAAGGVIETQGTVVGNRNQIMASIKSGNGAK